MTFPVPSRCVCLGLGLLGLLLLGCGGSDDQATFGDWTMKTGELRLEEDLRISETENFYFGSVTDLDVTTDGRLLVADREANAIKVLRPDGTLLDTLGGTGGGPGEFEALSSVQAARGDSIYAYDVRNGRLTVFGPGYRVVRTISVTSEQGSASPMLVLEQTLVGGFSGFISTNTERLTTWRIVQDGGTPGDTLMQTRWHQMAMTTGNGNRGWNVPFGRRTIVTIGPDSRIYYGWTDSLRVRALSPGGSSRVVASVPAPPVPVREAERDSALREVNSGPLRAKVASKLPATKPAFTDLVVAEDGRLWVRRPPEGPGADTADWWVLDPETKTIQEARLPRSVTIEEVRGQQVYGTTTTRVGAPAVVRYEVGTGT